MGIMYSAFKWAFWFSLFLIINLNVYALLMKNGVDSLKWRIENEKRRLKELEDISRQIDEYADNIKLMICEKRLENCKRAYRARQKN